MSRSGYSTDLDDWDLIRWRGQVASAIRGKRGQKFLVDLLAALDALPQKSLIVDELQEEGQVCAIGALGLSRGLDMSKIDPEDADPGRRLEAIGASKNQQREMGTAGGRGRS